MFHVFCFGPSQHAWSKTKHTKHLPQADEQWSTDSGTSFVLTLCQSPSSHAGEISCSAMQKFRHEADRADGEGTQNVTPNSAPGLTREGLRDRQDLI